jgi:hypothetical protein
MSSRSTAPRIDPDEAAVLEQLDKLGAVIAAKPMPAVAARLRELAQRVVEKSPSKATTRGGSLVASAWQTHSTRPKVLQRRAASHR